MNSKIKVILASAACMAACATIRAQAPGAMSAPGNSMQPSANPMMGQAPSAEYVWMSGHWDTEGGQWKWVAAHWDLPPSRSAVWVAGHWVQGGSGWVWVNGAWNVAQAPQSPNAPPMPPGQGSVGQAPGQGVPMPSTPAPNVSGQYSQYPQVGQVPVIDQPAVVTDYAPIDYSVDYPGYYWGGDAWAWGIYPGAFFGWGWGPGYYGRGGWGYGRGGY